MPVTRVTDVAELDPAKVQQSLAFIEGLTQEEHPSIDARFGVLHNLLLLPSAEHAAANQEDVARYGPRGTPAAVAALQD